MSLGSLEIDNCIVCTEHGVDTQALVGEVLQQFVLVTYCEYFEENGLFMINLTCSINRSVAIKDNKLINEIKL